MYQRIFSAKNSSPAKSSVFWIIGVVILESIISLLGLTGSVAILKGYLPDIISQEQLLKEGRFIIIVAKQSASESIIPVIAICELPILQV